jgi:4-amino-4-deoxy-L-arabinose transferase-like glycosyltransferase
MKERAQKRQSLLVLIILMLLAFALRSYMADTPFGGFHSFNEGWYSIIASKYTTLGSLLFPTSVYGRVDYNVSPFLSYALYAMASVFGWSEGVLRLVPMICSVMTLPVLYALGSRFFGIRAGLVAAAFYAFIPVSVITGRNVQTDALYVFFMLCALLLYLKGCDPGRRKPAWMFGAGLLFGTAFLSKQFAVLLLPPVFIWEAARHRGVKWFGWGQLAFAAGALIVPGPFFFYHLYHHLGLIGASQRALSVSQFEWLDPATWSYIGSEYYWGFSPALVAVAAPAAVYFLFRRREGASLSMLAAGVFAVFFSHWHGHSYYILFAAPFVCLLAGGAIQAMKPRAVPAVLTAALVAAACVQSIAFLCAVKYGYDDFYSLSKFLKDQKRPVVIATEMLSANYYPPLRYYNRDVDILTEKELANIGKDSISFGADRRVFVAGLAGDDDARMPCMKVYIMRRVYGLFVFGYYIMLNLESEHFFKVDGVLVRKAGGFRDTGIRLVGMARSLVIGVPRPGAPVPMRNGRMAFGCPSARKKLTNGK